MANPSTSFFTRRVSSAAFDLKLAQGVCFVGSVVVLGSSWWKLWHLELTEVQLLFGVQLSLVAPLLLVIIGLLLPNVLPAPPARS